MTRAEMEAAHVLLGGVVDYAGLFPPAALAMADAVAEYHRHRQEPSRWALGRFVVPAARLDEFLAAARPAGLLPAPAEDPVVLSVLATGDLPAGLAAVARVQAACAAEHLQVAAIETRATTPAEAREVAAMIPAPLEGWVEIPLGPPPGPLVEAVLAGGARPKIRTGGVAPELFPAPEAVLEFLAEVVRRGTPFKATAGLHHPLRGEYPYTYDEESPRGMMYGYLNLLTATALLREGAPPESAREALLESDPAALRLAADGLHWRGRRFEVARLQELRRQGLRAFGSCSFREPMDELHPFLRP